MLNDKGEEVGIIYGWYNTKSEKWYIGQTIDEEGRFKRHIYNAINKKDNTHFHRAIRKYGLENFVYCILEENVLVENLNMREIWWIEYYDSYYNGYNMTLGGDGVRGVVISEEIRRKIAEKLKGQIPWNKGKHGVYSEETIMKLSESHKGQIPWNKGLTYTFTEEEKDKLYESRRGITGYWKGKHLSEETRKKLSESHMGKKMSEEARKRMSESRKGLIPWNKGKTAWNTGKHGIYSEETRKRMSESHKGKPSNKRKKVSKYDLTGNYIQTYNSITDAVKENPKCTSIIGVCKGKFKQSGGFIWKYA